MGLGQNDVDLLFLDFRGRVKRETFDKENYPNIRITENLNSKTTSAIGLAVWAAGNNLQVDFVQLMKSGNSGEAAIFDMIPNINYWCPGEHQFILSRGPEPVHYEHASRALRYALDAVERGTNLLICNELLDTNLFKLLQN